MVARQKLHWAWVILIVCFVDLFINYSVRLGYGVVLPEMIQTLGIGRAAGGSIYNSYLFTDIAITPFTGGGLPLGFFRPAMVSDLLPWALPFPGWPPISAGVMPAFLINILMAVGAIILISFVRKKKWSQNLTQ